MTISFNVLVLQLKKPPLPAHRDAKLAARTETNGFAVKLRLEIDSPDALVRRFAPPSRRSHEK
jgi:hypothetical protein